MNPAFIFDLILGIISALPREDDKIYNESLIAPQTNPLANINTQPAESSTIRDKVERMALVNAAMWSLISEKLGITAEELMSKIREIDTIDGQQDGKVTSTAQNCPKCSRVMNSVTGNCLYCGYTPPASDVSIQVASGNMKVGKEEPEKL
jgi:hypothetical protein